MPSPPHDIVADSTTVSAVIASCRNAARACMMLSQERVRDDIAAADADGALAMPDAHKASIVYFDTLTPL